LLTLAALLATVAITWPLWNTRATPPLLPLVPLPQVSLGVALVVAAAGTLVRPRVGLVVLTALLAYGMLIDQTRMQPQFISLPILLWGTLPSNGWRLLARAHLITLWFFAGLHKLLSPEYLAGTGPRLVDVLPLPVPGHLVVAAAAGIALMELATGLLALVPPTRRLAAWSALGLHAGILITLAPLGEARNLAIWPWNIVLAVSGFALIAPWRESPLMTLHTAPRPARLAVVALALLPIGFYAGVVDAYPAHHLYSAATARATIYCPAGCPSGADLNATWLALNVPLPPEPRLFRAYFTATCGPGDALRIVDPYPPPWDTPHGRIEACPRTAVAAHP
jgi:hypothetical protein